ncbi:hypothetical protein D3C78_1219990 [compost metagenome]
MIHHGHPGRHTLADDSTRGQRTVAVEHFDPVVIHNPQLFRVHVAHPHNRATTPQRQHQQVVAVRGVNAPFLVRRQEVQRFFRETVRRDLAHVRHAAGINRRTIGHQAFPEGAHPLMILIQLLTSGEGAPRNEFVNVRVSGVIGNVFTLDA